MAVTLAPTGHRGGSYIGTDGAIDPPRNVRAYSLAMQAAGVELRERTAFTGLRTEPTAGGGQRVTGVQTSAGTIETERVLLTGGPSLRAVGRLAGLRIPAGAARHTVCVLEPHPAFDVERMPMVFDIGEGLYWRLEEGGLLFGYSDPDETPGEARQIDWAFHERMRERLGGLVPLTKGLGLRKIWVATIDYTPDHLPILGPALLPDGSRDRGRDGRLAGRSRDDVGAGRRPRRRRPRPARRDGPDRRDRPGPRPLRRARRQPAGDRSRSRCRSRWSRTTTRRRRSVPYRSRVGNEPGQSAATGVGEATAGRGRLAQDGQHRPQDDDRADPLLSIQAFAQQQRAGRHADDRDEIERDRGVRRGDVAQGPEVEPVRPGVVERARAHRAARGRAA